MTETKGYGPSRPLPRFEDAECLGPRDAEFVRDLVAVLEKHGNLDRFGLCLLHDHFPLGGDEILVETNDPQSRTLSVRVEKTGLTRHAKASQWRFVSHSDDARGTESSEGGPYQVVLLCKTLDLCPGADGPEAGRDR
ncbi:hypothetical protein [Streptomyces sp. NPDC048603]|uniref:hypothetical protein n=1 Tax=Streptomyces sp. NPDC048603 TaxID=3365577 RepID=UPI0037115C12